MKRVLLLEPNYSNKYPPMGLMKLAMYHRLQKGWDVVFYKGDLEDFVVSEYVRKAIECLKQYETDMFWEKYTPDIHAYFKTGKIVPESRFEFTLQKSLLGKAILSELRNDYKKGEYPEERKWDRICVTTLFTFYWKITIETILFAKKIVKDSGQIMVGGVLASVVPEEVKEATGIVPFCGCIYDRSIFDDPPISKPIDSLPLDYSILDEIDYQYPVQDGYYAYTTRGCVNRCKFCAVPKLEPEYQNYIPLLPRIKDTRKRFGEQKDLLLLDNNVFASDKFDQIIDDIRKAGFGKGQTVAVPNQLEIVIQQLTSGWNDRAYIRKGVRLLNKYVETLSGEEYKEVYSAILERRLEHDYTATKEDLLTVCQLIRQKYAEKHKKRRAVKRYIDFNQGVDARLATEERIKKLSEVAIRPLRVAFDNWNIRQDYVRAIYLASKYQIEQASNYLLYNFQDAPIDLYNRLLLNIDLSTALPINIYSFPMKYHPIMDKEWFTNRDYLGKQWNRKSVRTIQTILNATLGKVGSSRPFFFAAFGRDLDTFNELLRMPDLFIINRYDAEAVGLTDEWRESYKRIQARELDVVDSIVSTNRFEKDEWKDFSKEAIKFLEFYLLKKEDIPQKSPEQRKEIMEKYIASCPAEISSECARLLDLCQK